MKDNKSRWTKWKSSWNEFKELVINKKGQLLSRYKSTRAMLISTSYRGAYVQSVNTEKNTFHSYILTGRKKRRRSPSWVSARSI